MQGFESRFYCSNPEDPTRAHKLRAPGHMTHPNAFIRRHGAAIGPNKTWPILSSTFRYFDLTYSSAWVSVSESLSSPCSSMHSCQIQSQQLCINWTNTFAFSFTTGRRSGLSCSLTVEGSLEGDREILLSVLSQFSLRPAEALIAGYDAHLYVPWILNDILCFTVF